jgi:GT2 family glycosyltransferase
MLTYVIPTRNRPRRLLDTLARLERLGDHQATGGAEVIVIDNASEERAVLPRVLAGSVRVREIRLGHNASAAARNRGVEAADPRSEWIVMLDDDSYPLDLRHARVLREVDRSVAAVSADILLASRDGTPAPRESGGLPEVFVGCGVALRRSAFEQVGGYDESFEYYAEEYDLSARLLASGWCVRFDPMFRVRHAKDRRNRDMDAILRRLVRNNCWVAQRYAPESCRRAHVRDTVRRYHAIAAKEAALDGFAMGLSEARRTLRLQARAPLSDELWDRFTGLAAAREALGAAWRRRPFECAALVDEGKNAWVVRHALEELGVRIAAYGEPVDAEVIATMSPGPMLDAWGKRRILRRAAGVRVLAPWRITAGTPRVARSAA